MENSNNETCRHDNLQLLYRRDKADHVGPIGVASNREDADSSVRWVEEETRLIGEAFLLNDSAFRGGFLVSDGHFETKQDTERDALDPGSLSTSLHPRHPRPSCRQETNVSALPLVTSISPLDTVRLFQNDQSTRQTRKICRMLGVLHDTSVEVPQRQRLSSSQCAAGERSTAVPVRRGHHSVGGLRREVCSRIPTIPFQAKPIVARGEQEKNDKVRHDRDLRVCSKRYWLSFSSHFRLKLLHQFSKLLVVVFFWRFMLGRSKKLRDLWSRMLGMIVSMFKFLPMIAA